MIYILLKSSYHKKKITYFCLFYFSSLGNRVSFMELSHAYNLCIPGWRHRDLTDAAFQRL